MPLGLVAALAIGLSLPTAASASTRAPLPTVISFAASSTSLPASGGSVTLTTHVTNSTSCAFSVTPSVASMPQTKSCSTGTASVTVSLPAAPSTKAVKYTFAMTASGSGTAKTKAVKVTVAAQVAPTVTSFAANASSLPTPGGDLTLAASVANATSCTVTATPSLPGLPATTSCTQGRASFPLGVPANAGSKNLTYKFTLSATGAGVTKTASASVIEYAGGLTHISSSEYTYGYLSGGIVKCWGCSSTGAQVQRNALLARHEAQASPANSSGPVTLALSGALDVQSSLFSCALLSGGSVDCWGASNNYGQLGNGSTTPLNAPTAIAGLSGVTGIAVDLYSACAVMSDGTVECWGDNAQGQLGNGSTTNSSTPVQVTGLSNIQAISRGVSHNCALDASGNVYCWGDGVTTPEFVLSGASAISAGGNHTCALMTTGTVECWGFNGTLLGGVNGELGNGSTGNSLTPVTVTGISNAVAVEGGVDFTCALLATGPVECWGLGAGGVLGNGTMVNTLTPVMVLGISNAMSLAVGLFQACVLLTTSEMACWGGLSPSELGTRVGGFSDVPVPIATGYGPTTPIDTQLQFTSIPGSVTSGTPFSTSVAIGTASGATDGTANSTVTLGSSPSGVTCTGGTSVAAVDGVATFTGCSWAGSISSFVLTATTSSPGTLAVTSNSISYIGPPSQLVFSSTPTQATSGMSFSIQPVVDIEDAFGNVVGPDATVTLSSSPAGLVCTGGLSVAAVDGAAAFQGCSFSGSMASFVLQATTGVPSTLEGATAPISVPSLLSGVQSVQTGAYTTYALMDNGTVEAWGYGEFGELGNGTTTNYSDIPVQVKGLVGVQSIALMHYWRNGEAMPYALMDNGTVEAWGSDAYGLLGHGVSGSTGIPVAVFDSSGQ